MKNFKSLLLAIPTLIPLLSMASTSQIPDAQRVTCFINAYTTFIYGAALDEKAATAQLYLSNGEIIPWNDNKGKTYTEKMNTPDLQDTVSLTYPKGRNVNFQPAVDDDPGRFRDQNFLKAIYGANASAIRKNLIYVAWPFSTKNKTRYYLFNKQNGAAQALANVSHELAQLPSEYRKYLVNIGGTYNARNIAGTKITSAHTYGIAIDINIRESHYWRDDKNNLRGNYVKFHNNIPQKIVDVFERNGFIWGGRWYHYDTMHFEYRPELLQPNCIRS